LDERLHCFGRVANQSPIENECWQQPVPRQPLNRVWTHAEPLRDLGTAQEASLGLVDWGSFAAACGFSVK
jgi:hypothetical protein